MMTTTLQDMAIRQEVLSPGESFHVESPAGAGKTSLLTARFIHLLTQVDHPQEILALTFTNKAANEMLERVQTILLQAEKDIPSDSDWMNDLLITAKKALKKQAGNKHLFQAPDGLQITTFHSFCNQIIKQAPAEAQVPLEAVILSQEEQNELIQEALGRTQQTLLALPPSDPGRKALERILLYLNNNWKALAADLAQLTAQRDLMLDLLNLVREHPNPDHLDQVLRERFGVLVAGHLKDLRERFASTDLGRQWDPFYRHLVMKGALMSDRLPSGMPEDNWSDLPAWQAIAELGTTKGGSVRKQFGPKNGFYSGFKQTTWAGYWESLPQPVVDLLQKIKPFPSPETSPVDVGLLFDLILLIGQVVDQYRRSCLKRGVIDFVELEQAALRVLGNEETPADLQLLLDQRINHVLVDEFQDTSLNQWLLLQYLCAGWSPGDGRTLFVVGDPKQSIYGFRKAEVSLFLKARKGLPLPGQGTLPLKPVYISTNFRSRKKILEFVNALFSQTIMAHPNREADEVPFQEALAAPEMETQEPGKIRLALFGKEEDALLSRIKEAAWLAGQVKQVSRDPRNGSIGILLFARTHLPLYLKALYAQGLQVQVQEGLYLGERPEVRELLSLSKALVRPHDDLAWAALVRSAWCWVGLDELVQISQRSALSLAGKITVFSQDSQAPEAVQRLGQVLAHYQKQVGRHPLHRVVQTVWEELSGPQKVAERFGLSGVRNCRQFLQLLFQAEKGLPEETWSHLEFRLATAYAPPDPLASRSAVQIMTVHHAKGLEFDTVFLPHIDRNPLEGGQRESPPYLLERLPGEREEHLIALRPDRRTKEDSGIYGLLKGLGKERRLGEAKRLFYVALTRAKKNLTISGLVVIKEEEEKAPDHSLLGYILNHPGYEAHLEILNDPPVPEPVKEPTQPMAKEEHSPWPLASEPLPYRIILPSGLHEEGLFPAEIDSAGEPSPKAFQETFGQARGTVMHRILEHLAEGKDLPTEKAVVTALINEGVGSVAAAEMTPRLLEEVRACQQEAFCSYILRRDHPLAASEFSLEDQVDERTLRSGIIDRLVFDGRQWFIVDYKTTPLPDDMSVVTFFKTQAALYLDQLSAYKEMLARVRLLEPAAIRLFLYFT
ncbi:MAG: UvrD-helicase domain-containing protein, partial [Pseudomonadota bacterium]